MRSSLGGDPLPYVWVPEWHKTDHGLHGHFAVGRYIKKSLIQAAWPHGFIHIKLLGDLPAGSGPLAEARVAAGYLSKYVGKSFDEESRIPGLHRYEVAQGFQPSTVQVYGRTVDAAIDAACEVMRSRPDYVWNSDQVEGWEAPPAVWVSWRG